MKAVALTPEQARRARRLEKRVAKLEADLAQASERLLDYLDTLVHGDGSRDVQLSEDGKHIIIN